MNEIEITSPPFTTNMCTPVSAYRQLLALEGWVNSLRPWANEEAARFEAPDTPFIPELPPTPVNPAILSHVSIPSLFRTWMTMRAVRERWDWILRNYEENWDCDKCIFSRVNCVKSAADVLRYAFMDPETHEAKQEEERISHNNQVSQTLKKLGIPDTILEAMGVLPDDEEKIDFDKLFHPEDD